jgi:hypothetical protein
MRQPLLIGVAVACSTALIAAQAPATARFQFEKTADVAAGGPQRLDLDVQLLTGSKPFAVVASGDRAIARNGLGDLRLFSNNVEVPYLLIPPGDGAPAFISGRILPLTSVDTTDNKSSGFEVDLQNIAIVNAIDLDAIGAPFLKRFRLEGSGDRRRWTQLIDEGTAFNLPAEGIRHTRIEFDAGPYRYLRITWDDTNSARVNSPSRVLVRQVTEALPGATVRVPVTVTRRASEPGRSRFRLTLPGARLPIVALELSAGGGYLLRDARVFEPSLVGQAAQPRLLGQSRLIRIVRDEIPADALRIPIAPPTEPQLDLVVDDGDNPPLELDGVTAVFAELPWIYFEAPAPGAIVARYGDPRLAAPRYDLEAARAAIDDAPARAWRPQPPVALGVEPEALPMPQTGSAISTDGFGYARDLPDGPEGLIVVPLDAAVLAHSGVSRQLGDIRIVDRSGMQVPYLLERRDEPVIVTASIERRGLPSGVKAGSQSASSYLVHPPFSDLPDARLVLTTRARVFKRTATLGIVRRATDRQPARFVPLETQPWLHADEAVAAPPLTFAMPAHIDGDLFLIVEEGDNQPLDVDRGTILMPAYAVRLFRRPQLPLRLVYGNNRIGSPQYDLQLLAPQLLGRTAEEVAPGPERVLAEGSGDSSIELVSPMVFWAVLTVTVVVLLGLVVRLIRREAH